MSHSQSSEKKKKKTEKKKCNESWTDFFFLLLVLLAESVLAESLLLDSLLTVEMGERESLQTTQLTLTTETTDSCIIVFVAEQSPVFWLENTEGGGNIRRTSMRQQLQVAEKSGGVFRAVKGGVYDTQDLLEYIE